MPGMRERSSLDSAGAAPSSPAGKGRSRVALAVALVAGLAAAAYFLAPSAGAGPAELAADAGPPDAAPAPVRVPSRGSPMRAIDPAPATASPLPGRTDTAHSPAPGQAKSFAGASPYGARYARTVPGAAAAGAPATARISCTLLPHAPPRLEQEREMFTALGDSRIFTTELDCGHVRAAYLIDPGNATQWRLTAVYTDTARLCPDATPGVYRHADGSITWQSTTPIRMLPCSLEDSLAASVWVPTTVVSESRPPAPAPAQP
jgi:hypothetical protein